MEILKEYRFTKNPLEKDAVEKFIKEHTRHQDMDLIVFGHGERLVPNDYLTDREKSIVLSTIQWIATPVGQGFLQSLQVFKELTDKE